MVCHVNNDVGINIISPNKRMMDYGYFTISFNFFPTDSQQCGPGTGITPLTCNELKLGSEYRDNQTEPNRFKRVFGWTTIHSDTYYQQSLLTNKRTMLAEQKREALSLDMAQASPQLTEAEHQQILVEWNDTATDYPADKTIHQLFEEQVKRTPDNIAVVFEGEQLTYTKLNQQANQLAHHLQSLDVGPEMLVGLCVERSIEMVIGLLGILKAGGAYVPLDPSYPAERLAFMLADANVSILLTQSHLRDSLPEISCPKGVKAQVVCLDTQRARCSDWREIKRLPTVNLEVPVKADNLAYLMFTSGSTGRPKGTLIIHRSVIRLVKKTNYIQFDQNQIFLQLAPLSFDASTLEIWGPFLNGGRLVIMPPHQPSLKEIGDYLTRYGITTLWLTAGLFHLMVDERANDLSSLKQLLAGGDVLSADHVRKAVQALNDGILINGYGPTENTTFTCCYPVQDLETIKSSVPIGKPIANTQAYILDPFLEPVPIGVSGELYISGVGLARGYLNRPELTAEKFIPNPFDKAPEFTEGLRACHEPVEGTSPLVQGIGTRSGEYGVGTNSRLYKTGDLARWLPDGNIEFIGRIDHQVKIRGFRIELGEIETVLSQHKAVQDVVAQTQGSGEQKRLVAYLIATPLIPNPQSLIPELRDYLQKKLPDYMIPSAFVLLDAFPLTPNGKVDRQGLTEPDSAALATANEFSPPQTPTENILASVWAEVLGVERVGRHDDFFELGGHSLLATQVVSRLRMLFETGVRTRTLFEAATLLALAKRIDALRQSDKQLLPLPPLIQAAERPQSLPLSFAQQRLWFLDQLEGPSPTYNIPLALRMTGNLNIPALEAALNEIVARHEALRTTFPAVDGVAQQWIAPTLYLPLEIVDPSASLRACPEPTEGASSEFTEGTGLRSLSEQEQGQALLERLNQDAWQPFDLTTGPLLRVVLYRLSESEWVLLLNMHHIISDGWSIGVLIRELSALYEAFSRKRPSPLPALEIQYADFTLWQRAWLQGEVLEKQLHYWRTELANAPTLSDLPTDYPRPARLSFKGDMIHFELGTELSQQLNVLSRKQGVSLFMTLYGALAVLLYRYSGQDDIVIGTPIANRHLQAIEPLIGFFVNTLALRADLSNNPPFTELLEQVRQTTLNGYTHQDFPFEQLVNELDVPRHLSHTPLFQVMLAFNNTQTPLSLSKDGTQRRLRADLEFSRLWLESQIARFDLTLFVNEIESGLQFDLEYNSDLFAPETIERMAGHFEVLLNAIVENPAQSISQLPMLTEKEIQQLQTFNETGRDYPKELTIVDLFEQQVEKTPDNIAVIFEYQQLSYRELNHKANQLAHYLLLFKNGTGDFMIAIAVERSLEMVIGLLAILKAGGAYVPIEPSYPTARIRYLLDDSAAPLLLTQSHLKAQLETDCVVVCLDEVDFVRQPTENPLVSRTATDLAYVIYTSGSTGKPKGAMNTHTGIVNRLLWMQETYQLTIQDRILQKTPFSFDVSVWEFLWPLLNGAGLVVAKPEGHKDPAYLASVIAQYEITVLHFVPSMLQAFLNQAKVKDCSSLKMVICSGEALSFELMQQFLAHFADLNIELHNLYGPTEAAVDVSYCPCRIEAAHTSVPIGKPVANTQLYVLDAAYQILPIGVPGELCIGGIQVGHGYHGRPELTAEKFIEVELFGKTERIYKTGDLARWREDGNLEYLGRLDHQIKLRGFRIELGEIEAVLTQYEAINETVVILLQRDGNPSLAAYLTSREPLETPAIRDWLKARLPDYMIPAHFTVLEEMPLTPNGKIDRKALEKRATEENFDLETAGYVAPRTAEEELLANIWANLLGLERVGVHDNFFKLGGHSLLATQLISRIRDCFEVELPVKLIFQHPVLCELAEQITQSQTFQNTPLSDFIKIRKQEIPTDAVVPMSITQLEMWFTDQLYPHVASMNYMLFGYRFLGPLNVSFLTKSLRQMVQVHEVLRSVFVREEDKVIRVVPEHFKLPFEQIDLRAAMSTTEREAAVQKQINNLQFDLAQGPLWRCILWQLNEEEYWFLFAIHHIISDGWSMGVITKKMAQYYRALDEGLPITPTQARLEYKHFAAWQWHYFNSEKARLDRDYWCTVLKEPPPPLTFADSPRLVERNFAGDVYHIKLTPTLLAELQQLSRQTESTLFVTLLTAFKLLLFAYTQRQDLIVGTTLANRTQAELENEMGLFVNILPIRTDLSDHPSTRELLLRVMESTMGVIAHQQTPIIKVLEWVQPQRSTKHAQLQQVFFALQNTPEISLTLSQDIQVSELPLPQININTEFDLYMSLEENPDGISGVLWYRKDLFSHTWIAKFCEDYQNILQRLVAMLDEPIETLTKDIGTNRPETERPQTTEDVTLPTPANQHINHNETERLLMVLWQDILGTSELSIDDDFFTSGGGSLQLLTLLNQIEHTFACRIPIRALFEKTTIRQQSQFILPLERQVQGD